MSRRARKQAELQVKDKVGAGEQEESTQAGGQWTRWTGDWQCGRPTSSGSRGMVTHGPSNDTSKSARPM